MIISTLMAAAVAAQPTPAPQSTKSAAPAAEKEMACCDKMATGEGCACCKDMDQPGRGADAPSPGDADGHNH